jgi:rhodanese-related sulfurtransferase
VSAGSEHASPAARAAAGETPASGADGGETPASGADGGATRAGGGEAGPAAPGRATRAECDPARAARSRAPAVAPPGSRGIDEILTAARQRLCRLDPAEAREVHRCGGVLVDIRPHAQRRAEGGIPGALVIERNHLEWRFDPRSDTRLDVADRYDLPVVVFCSEGYTSSLAAAALQDLGLWRATDLAGGFVAWREAGLPVESIA